MIKMWYLFDSGICRITNLNVVGDFKIKKILWNWNGMVQFARRYLNIHLSTLLPAENEVWCLYDIRNKKFNASFHMYLQWDEFCV